MEQNVKNPAPGLLPPHLASDYLAFPYTVADLQAVQTHISIVFLAGDFAYKIKKPVRFPFVDYSTLEKRKEFCECEVDWDVVEVDTEGPLPESVREIRLVLSRRHLSRL